MLQEHVLHGFYHYLLFQVLFLNFQRILLFSYYHLIGMLLLLGYYVIGQEHVLVSLFPYICYPSYVLFFHLNMCKVHQQMVYMNHFHHYIHKLTSFDIPFQDHNRIMVLQLILVVYSSVLQSYKYLLLVYVVQHRLLVFFQLQNLILRHRIVLLHFPKRKLLHSLYCLQHLV